MKLTVKCIVDLSRIKEDPGVEKELLSEEKPLLVAMVCRRIVLAAEEIVFKRQEDLAKIAVTLTADYPCETTPGVYVVIGRNLPEPSFLAAEPFKMWLGPERFKNGVVDLTKEKITLPLHLLRRWIILCRAYTITGRVVKRVAIWDPLEQMYVHCDEPVPGAKVEAFDADCWWFWWKRDLVGSAITNPDGTFEMTFRWCCLLWLPPLRPRWVIDQDLLHHTVAAVKPHFGPIPPEALDSPPAFEKFLGVAGMVPASVPSRLIATDTAGRSGSSCAGKAAPPIAATAGDIAEPARLPVGPLVRVDDILGKLRPLLPFLPCRPFRQKDCTPDIVFRVQQECGGAVQVIYDEKPFQIRWNIPTNLNVTLLANAKACSVPVCEEPPPGNCLKFSAVNCVEVDHIGAASGVADLQGYAYPGSGDHPFTGVIRIKGRFGSGSAVDYFKVEYSFAGGPFKALPEDHLQAFARSYWAPPPGSPPGTAAASNSVVFKPEPVDGRIVYKTLRRAEQENPLPAGWLWGYLWNDLHTLFLWDSQGLDGDGLYVLRLLGYRYDAATKKLLEEQVMQTCELQTAAEEKVLVRIDNRNADDPVYQANEDRPCGAGTVHLCTYEPDCDFRRVELIRLDDHGLATGSPYEIGPCDIVEVSDFDDIVVHFTASVPKNRRDGHLLAYNMYAHWGEDKVFDVIATGTLAADPDILVGPTYSATFAGAQGTHRGLLPVTEAEHDRPFWFGGSFKVSLKGSAFKTSCAYTLSLRVWKRTIEGCTDPVYVHVNWCSYSFTIKKI
jgi:hypothetical protein